MRKDRPLDNRKQSPFGEIEGGLLDAVITAMQVTEPGIAVEKLWTDPWVVALADGLLSAAMAEAFSQFLESKKAAVQSPDPVVALREGWDDYVRFAAARPRLYAAMMSRVLSGARIPAAEQAFALLIERITAIAADGRLALAIAAAADLAWASANAASLLYVTAQLRNAAPPTPGVLEDLRESAMQTILTTESKGGSS